MSNLADLPVGYHPLTERPILRGYQVECKEKAAQYAGFLILCEQRTGKTPIACELTEDRQPELLIIACPKIAIGVWEDHLQWYKLKNTRVIITTLESAWGQRRQIRKLLEKAKTSKVIVDESHRIKDKDSKMSRVCRAWGRVATWRLAMTGTPIEGKIWDAWAQFDFIDPTIFGRWSSKTDGHMGPILEEGFKDRYLRTGGFRGLKVIGAKSDRLEEFEKKFHSRSFRVLLEDVKPVPTQLYPPQVVSFELEEEEEFYRQMEEKFIVEIKDAKRKVWRWVPVEKKIEGEWKTIKVRRKVQNKKIIAPRVITQAMKLHQISGGFIYDEERLLHHLGDTKMAHTGALLLKLGKVPTVIVVRFIPELERIALLCKQLGRTVTKVSGQYEYRGWNTDVCVIQIQKGVSIDLARAEELIFHSWMHSFLTYEQARFRIRSYWGLRARYWYLIAKNTIDQDLFDCVTRKLNFSNHLVNKYRRK